MPLAGSTALSTKVREPWIAAESPSATTYFHLARAQALAGRRSEARRAWDGAIKLGLRAERLHVLERPAFQQLEREFR